jgi:hypothetical protein
MLLKYMYKYTKVMAIAMVTGVLALGMAAALTGKALADGIGQNRGCNSDSCAKTIAPGHTSAPEVAPGTRSHDTGEPAKDFAPGQEKP